MTKSNNNKEWVCVGKLFIRLPQPTVKSILESGEFQQNSDTSTYL